MSVNDFKYYIACHGSEEMEIIATFRYKSDRGYALDALEESCPDCKFEKVGVE